MLEEEKKHKATKKMSNTLLAMINSSDIDSDSSSYSNNEKPKKKVKEKLLSSSKKISNRSRAFDLDEEARDVEEMINAIEEENQVPRETMQKLKRLRITLRHTVPPQHQVETCAGSRGPTPRQKKLMESFGPIKYGKFTPEEDKIIIKNWKSFCKGHDWDSRDVRPFLYMRHERVFYIRKFRERQKFVQYLADGLPWRTLYSVYWRFRNLKQPHLQTRYNKEEDKLIIAHMENSSAIDTKNVKKFSDLAKILNRTRASVWRRYRLLKQKNRDPLRTSIQWTLPLIKKFINYLMQFTVSTDIHQLKDLDIPSVVWDKLSEKFNINCRDLKVLWQNKLHMQLFCKRPVYQNDVKIQLIEYFYVAGITEWWEIDWGNIVKHFDGMTSSFISLTFSDLINLKKNEGMEFNELLEYLYQVKKPQLQHALKDKFLPRLVYENGTLKVLDTETNEQGKTGKRD